MIRRTVILTAFTLIAAASLAQGVPPLVNYQGLLRDDQGNPLTSGDYNIEFRIYDDPVADSLVWGPQTFNDVSVIDGRFNVILGPVDDGAQPISDGFATDEAYLSIAVSSLANPTPETITPRQQILSSPYALRSGAVADGGVTQSSLALPGTSYATVDTPFTYTVDPVILGSVTIDTTGRPVLVGFRCNFIGIDNVAQTAFLSIERSIDGGAFEEIHRVRFGSNVAFDVFEIPATFSIVDVPAAGSVTYRIELDSSRSSGDGSFTNNGEFYALEL